MRTLSSYREMLSVAVGSLISSKLRSFLTVLGVILATTTLVVVMSMVHGMDVYVANQVSAMGTDGFRIQPHPDARRFRSQEVSLEPRNETQS